MELKVYFRLIQRGWWMIALSALVALNVSLTLSYLATPMYRATARFIVSPNITLISDRDLVKSLEALDKRSIVSTYAEILDSARIYTDIGQMLEIPPDVLDDYDHSTVVAPDANILELSVEGPDPKVVTLLANSIGQWTISYIRELYQIYEISFLDPATVPGEPFSPQPVRDAGLSLVLGTLVGMMLAVVRSQLRVPLEAFRQRRTLDKISSAYNRDYFERLMVQEVVETSNNAQDLSLGVVYLSSLEDFMDTLPQSLVQQILHQVTRILRNELRGSSDSVGRWDETSFVVLLPATPNNAANSIMKRIKRSLSKPIALEHTGEAIDLSPATSVIAHQKDESTSELVERIDLALAHERTMRQV